jgi:hypothetical protein
LTALCFFIAILRLARKVSTLQGQSSESVLLARKLTTLVLTAGLIGFTMAVMTWEVASQMFQGQ